MGLTKVQAGVLTRLAAEPGGKATVGRGLPFKCNRITARALRDLGLVATDARYADGTAEGEGPYFIELTQKGRDAAAGVS